MPFAPYMRHPGLSDPLSKRVSAVILPLRPSPTRPEPLSSRTSNKMKYFPIRFVFIVGICAAGWIAVTAQTKELKPARGVLGSMIRERQTSLTPFVIVSPSELEKAGVDLMRLSALGDPCNEAAPISVGQTVNGFLSSSDCRFDDGSFADFYMFNGTQGQQLTIDLVSSAFDTYLGLANLSGTFVIEDDDGGDGTNSRISASLPESGTYIIMANSVFANSFGAYSLTLAGSLPCTYSLVPSSANLPGPGGTFMFDVLTQPGCQWGAVASDGFITINNNNGNGSGTISYSVTPNTTGVTRSGSINVRGQLFSITQAGFTCVYSIAPTSADVPAGGGTFPFTLTTQAGCLWYPQTNDYWLWAYNGVRNGSGTVEYSVQPNNGGDRTGTITVAGNTFTITQTGRNCTYSVSPTFFEISPAGTQGGQFMVDTQPGCTWNFTGGFNYVYFPDGYGGIGPGTKTFAVWANNSFTRRTWIVQFYGVTYTNITFGQNGIPFRTAFDFFGDSKVDWSLRNPATGEWRLNDSQFNGFYSYYFGLPTDIMVPADYNGDRYTEIAVYRPSDGTWYIYDRANGSYTASQFGADGDIPAPGDYDGDGKSDLAVFRPSTGTWYIARSSDSGITILQFGMAGDKPVNADFDGDRRADIAIWRPSAGEWWYLRSSDGGIRAFQFGVATDRALPGDYTGDGKADPAVWRQSDGNWFVLRSEDSTFYGFPFGVEGDIPAPGDYDADGIIDAGVYRPASGVWYINKSSSGILYRTFGAAGEVPIPNAYVR